MPASANDVQSYRRERPCFFVLDGAVTDIPRVHTSQASQNFGRKLIRPALVAIVGTRHNDRRLLGMLRVQLFDPRISNAYLTLLPMGCEPESSWGRETSVQMQAAPSGTGRVWLDAAMRSLPCGAVANC